jgi:hypothetical protein
MGRTAADAKTIHQLSGISVLIASPIAVFRSLVAKDAGWSRREGNSCSSEEAMRGDAANIALVSDAKKWVAERPRS